MLDVMRVTINDFAGVDNGEFLKCLGTRVNDIFLEE
jgi:hypothetical protein